MGDNELTASHYLESEREKGTLAGTHQLKTD